MAEMVPCGAFRKGGDGYQGTTTCWTSQGYSAPEYPTQGIQVAMPTNINETEHDYQRSHYGSPNNSQLQTAETEVQHRLRFRSENG